MIVVRKPGEAGPSSYQLDSGLTPPTRHIRSKMYSKTGKKQVCPVTRTGSWVDGWGLFPCGLGEALHLIRCLRGRLKSHTTMLCSPSTTGRRQTVERAEAVQRLVSQLLLDDMNPNVEVDFITGMGCIIRMVQTGIWEGKRRVKRH